MSAPRRTLITCPECRGAKTLRVVAARTPVETLVYFVQCPTCRGVGVKAAPVAGADRS
jgi:DnaJ-class molecular chaperone